MIASKTIGARFSGLINIPDSGNWTFYLTSDDGSEMWLDGTSLVTNYGSHGMREMSGTRNVSAGLHDFKIEFFLEAAWIEFEWEGPNQAKRWYFFSILRLPAPICFYAYSCMEFWWRDWNRIQWFSLEWLKHDLVQHECYELENMSRRWMPMVRWCRWLCRSWCGWLGWKFHRQSMGLGKFDQLTELCFCTRSFR